MMTTISHLSDEELMAFAEGELPGSEAQAVETHVQECMECAARLDTWRQDTEVFDARLASWNAESVPEHVEHVVLSALAVRNSKNTENRSTTGGDKWRLWAGLVAGVAAAAVVLGYVTVQHQPLRLASYSSKMEEARQSDEPFTIAEDKAESARRAAANMPPRSAKQTDRFPGGLEQLGKGPMSDSENSKQFDRLDRFARLADAPAPSMAALPKAPPMMKANVAAGLAGGGGGQRDRTPTPSAKTPPLGPMIARTASLSILVDNVDKERVALENLLSRYGGYAAQMQVNTPEDGNRNLTASLRVPATALSQAIADLRTLGKVQNESQSGEDVGQDHADLQARLSTARSTEDRLRGILREHTGRVSDVLEVEEEIATTREKIESMEAELDGMEHRVRYATINLQLNETATKPAAHSVSRRLGDSISAGWHNAGALVLGLMLWLAEDGPAIAIVLLLIGVPAWWFWQRYQRSRL